MAFTTIDQSHGLSVKEWEKQFYFNYLRKTFWKKFMGKSENSVIQVKKMMGPGDIKTIGLATDLQGNGVTGNQTLKGQEEDFVAYSQELSFDELRHGVAFKGRMTEVRTAQNMRNTARTLLSRWDSKKLDDDMFSTLTASPTSTRVKYGTDFTETAVANVNESDDKVTIADISKMKRYAQTQNIHPVQIQDELEFYVYIMHPYTTKNLKADTNYTNELKDVLPRSIKHPLLTGALGMHDGVLLYESTRVPLVAEGTASINIARNLFMGSQAGAILWGPQGMPRWKEDVDDYGSRVGIAIEELRGISRLQFNSVDFACINWRQPAVAG